MWKALVRSAEELADEAGLSCPGIAEQVNHRQVAGQGKELL
jgi:hypothetical protein